MQTLVKVPKSEVSTAPTTEPITITEAKRQLRIAATDTSQDGLILRLMGSAREQFERDTDWYLIKRTMTVKLPALGQYQFPHRPINSITSISYYDADNTSRTLGTAIYQLDTSRNQLRLAYLKDWPTTVDRWDAVTITYVLGSHVDSTTVPNVAKSAMLLLVANEFEQADMMTPDYTQMQVAYERLVTKFMRASYP